MISHIAQNFHSSLISQIFNCSQNENFLRVHYSVHALTVTASMDNIPELCCRICKGCSPKRYHQSRPCFADSCELERRQCDGVELGIHDSERQPFVKI